MCVCVCVCVCILRGNTPPRNAPRSDGFWGGTRLSKNSHESEDLRVHSQGTRTIFGAACTSREADEFWREKASSTIEAASGSALQLNSDAHPLLPWCFIFFNLPLLNSRFTLADFFLIFYAINYTLFLSPARSHTLP